MQEVTCIVQEVNEKFDKTKKDFRNFSKVQNIECEVQEVTQECTLRIHGLKSGLATCFEETDKRLNEEIRDGLKQMQLATSTPQLEESPVPKR